jgi:hypothetical protein
MITLYFKKTHTTAGTDPEVFDMSPGVDTVGGGDDCWFQTTAGGTAIRAVHLYGGGVDPFDVAFYSERLSADLLITALSLRHYAHIYSGTPNASLRVRVYKITTGGSAVETLIGQYDDTSALGTDHTALKTWTLSIAPVQMVVGERLIVRFWAIPLPGQTMGAGEIRFSFGSSTANSMDTGLEVTPDPSFTPNGSRLYLRRTSTIGIDDFLDLTTAAPTGTDAVATISTGAPEDAPWTSVPGTGVLTAITGAAIASSTNSSSYTSASFTPVANRLYLLAVVHSDAAPEATVPTITTTTGLNFVQVGSSMAFDTVASNLHRITLFRAMKASGLSAGTYTVNLADAGTGCATALLEGTGYLTTGTDGADAVLNVTTRAVNASTFCTITSMGAFTQPYHTVVGVFGLDVATEPTPLNGMQTITSGTYATPTTLVYVAGRLSAAPTGTVVFAETVAGAADWAGIAVELATTATWPAVIEWISPRVKAPGFYLENRQNGLFTMYALGVLLNVHQSDAAANAAFRVRVYHRRGTTETLCATMEVGLEMGTTAIPTEVTSTGGQFTTGPLGSRLGSVVPIGFQPDDRLVIRAFLISPWAASLTLVPGHTAMIRYDGASYQSFIDVFDTNGWKAEGDPVESQAIPGGLSTLGIGNDGA